MIQRFLKNVDWINLLRAFLLIIFIFYINFYLVNSTILKNDLITVSNVFRPVLSFSLRAYAVSIVGISFYFIKDFNRAFFIKLGVGYLIYLIVSYFLLVTRNLNNENFDVWDIGGNYSFQNNFLLTFLIILAVSTVLYYLVHKFTFFKFVESYLRGYESKNIILLGSLASLIINDDQVLNVLYDTVSPYILSENTVDFILQLSANLILSLTAVAIIAYFVLNSYKAILDNKPSPELMISSSLLLATICNYTLQLGVRNDEPLLEKFIFPGATAYQILVLTCLFLLTYLLINRFLISTFLIVAFGTVISIVNSVKEGLRSEPLLVTDFIWLKEITLLTSFVDKSVIKDAAIAMVLVVAIYIALRKRILPGQIFQTKRRRGLAIASILGFGLFTFIIFRNEEDSRIIDGIPIISKANNWMDVNWMGFSTNASYKSLMYVWTKQLTKTIMDIPEGYSQESVLEIEEKYAAKADEINKTRVNEIQDQTVVVVLSESFADPARLDGISLSKNVIPNISQIEKDYTSGTMISDFYGGGTANLEIQALTGLPYTNLSPSVSVMNTEVLPKMSYVPSISDSYDNQSKIAVHLHNGANYSRNIVYKDLGFNTFIALDGTDDKPTQLEFLSAGARDRSTYHAVTSNLTTDTNQFFSVITMMNHIPWNLEEPADIVASGQGLSDDENESLTSYARLLTVTDSETADFLDELSDFDKKITVVFYGDHLPGLYPSSTFQSDPEAQFQTDYFIWSNYDTEKLDYPLVSSYDFPALLLKQTNSKVSPYYALLTELLDARNKSELEFEEVSKELQMIQYDLTLGKSYILDKGNFFTNK